jgi:hypothetical protein
MAVEVEEGTYEHILDVDRMGQVGVSACFSDRYRSTGSHPWKNKSNAYIAHGQGFVTLTLRPSESACTTSDSDTLALRSASLKPKRHHNARLATTFTPPSRILGNETRSRRPTNSVQGMYRCAGARSCSGRDGARTFRNSKTESSGYPNTYMRSSNITFGYSR